MNHGEGKQTRGVLRRGMAGCMATAAVLVGALLAGCGGEDKSGPSETGAKTPVAGDFSAKVSGVRAVTWLENMLTARGPKGERRLAPGDSIAAGESLTTAGGLEATLELSDRIQVVVAESTEVRLSDDGGVAGFELLSGEIRIARPLDSLAAIRLVSNGDKVTLGPGRFLATAQKGQSVNLIVEAGSAKDQAGNVLAAGQHHVIGSGNITVPHVPMPPLLPRIVATPLSPLVPKELIRVPSHAPVRGIGTLVARDPRTQKESGEALDLTLHRVRVTVRDGIARTEIEETFTNRSNRTVEGIYKFVLPSDASITRLALDVNGRIEEGEVLEKKQAKRIFKSIVEDSVRPRDPALLEWERSGSFSMRIFPITGGQTRRVFLSYMQPLTSKDGVYEYVYPMSSPAGIAQIGRFEIEVDASLSREITAVTTPLVRAQAETNGKSARVSFAAERFTPATDFSVRFAAASSGKEARIAPETDSTGRTYAMALLTPQILQGATVGARRVVVMLDSSYGIPKELFELAKQTVLETAAGLGPGDELAVLACDSDCATFEKGFFRVDATRVMSLAKWLDGIEPGGAGNLLGGLAYVFELAKGAAPADVIYIGDGSPTAGATNVPELVRLLQAIRPSNVSVHTVGLGANRDELALFEIAARLGGALHTPMVGESPQVIAAMIARNLGAASLKDVTISWPAGVEAAYPSYLGSLAAGQEVAVVARLAGDAISGELVLRGTDRGGRIVEKRYPVNVGAGSPRPSAVAKLWAKRHFDALTVEPDRETEIVALSRQMKIASRYTSWIVLENDRMYRQFGIERLEARRWDGQAPTFEEIEDLDDEAEEMAISSGADGAIAGYGRGGESLSAASSSRSAKKSASAPKAEATAMAKESMPDSRLLGPLSPDDSERTRYAFQKGYRVQFFTPRQPSAKALEKAASAASDVRQNPMVRTHHRRYLLLLARQGRIDEQLERAKAWIERDPLEPSALRAFADALARNGERERALRFYSGITKLSPNSPRIHRRLGEAYRDLGRYVAAAGHYRAAASSKTGADEDWQSYFECLLAAGLRPLLEEEARDETSRGVSSRVKSPARRKQVENILASSAVSSSWMRKRLSGPLKVYLAVQSGASEDVDIAVIDPGGRRISGAWPRNAAVQNLTDPLKEVLAVSWMQDGTYRVLVNRSNAPANAGSLPPVTGTVTVKCRDQRRTFPFTLQGAETEVALISYKEYRYR